MPNDVGLEYTVVGRTEPSVLSRMSTEPELGSTGSRDRSGRLAFHVVRSITTSEGSAVSLAPGETTGRREMV